MAGGYAEDPQVTSDPSGNLTAVWSRSSGGDNIVQAATKVAGGSWSAPTDLSAPGGYAQDPQVTSDPSGNLTAVWSRSDGSNYIIQAATKAAGGTWVGMPTDLSATGGYAYHPQVTIDSSGNVTAVWSRSDGGTYIVQAATKAAGGSWSAPTAVSAAGSYAQAPQVTSDASGNVTTVWTRSDSGISIVQAATKPVGGSWGAPFDVSAAGGDAHRPQLTSDASGNVTAVWFRNDGSNYIVQAATKPAGASWGAAIDLSAPGRYAQAPQVTSDPSGNLTAVWWLRGSGSDVVIQSTTMSWSYVVSFDANGGSGTVPASISSTAGVGVTVPSASGVTWAGHTFVGWNTAANGSGTSYSAGSTITPQRDVTLYAQWTSVAAPASLAVTGSDPALAWMSAALLLLAGLAVLGVRRRIRS